MYYPEGMKARVSPVQSIEPNRILAPIRDLNQEFLGPQSRVVTTILPLHTFYNVQHKFLRLLLILKQVLLKSQTQSLCWNHSMPIISSDSTSVWNPDISNSTVVSPSNGKSVLSAVFSFSSVGSNSSLGIKLLPLTDCSQPGSNKACSSYI